MDFSTSKHPFSIALLWLLAAGVVFILLVDKPDAETTAIVIFSTVGSVFAALIVWILLDTRYKIKDNQMHYYCGPIRGKINIQSIRKIEHLKTCYTYSLLKPALGIKGLVIHYNQFDDVYISPKEKEKFVAELLKINPNITVL